jgi:hypothetical protein
MITVHALGAQMQNVNSSETGFSARTDFAVVLHSLANNGLSSKNRFRFQDNIIKVNRVRESTSMCSDLMLRNLVVHRSQIANFVG